MHSIHSTQPGRVTTTAISVEGLMIARWFDRLPEDRKEMVLAIVRMSADPAYQAKTLGRVFGAAETR